MRPSSDSWLDRQNESEARVYLAASDFYWGQVQRLRALQILLVLAFPIALTIAAQFLPTLVVTAAFAGFAMTVIDTALFYPYIARERRQASQAQDNFDAVALSLARSDIRLEDQADRSSIQEAAARQDPRRASRNKDWYSPALGALPISIGRIGCMRESTAWDGGLRDRYVGLLWAGLIGLLIAITAYGVFLHQGLDEVLVRILFPVTPAIVWIGREIWDQSDSSRTVNALRLSMQRTWNSALQNATDLEGLKARAEQYAFALFAYREKTAPVPHVLYQLLRPKQTRSMTEAAVAAVEEFNQAATGRL